MLEKSYQEEMRNEKQLLDEGQCEQNPMEALDEVTYQLELINSKIEQSSFDAINSSDRVMRSLQECIEKIVEVMAGQEDLLNAIELASLSMQEKEGSALLKLANAQSKALEQLEYQFHQVAEAGVEVSDAIHCVEDGIDNQNTRVGELISLLSVLL